MDRRTFLNATLGALSAGFSPLPAASQSPRAPTGFIRTNWSRDPYSFGSYSYIAKGARRRDHAALGAPVDGRLFFAGEATHPDYNSTVHAAYESGHIAAEAVFESEAESVAIIGAGVSGLAAAIWLRGEGLDVTVFEARNRIGGRVWTDRSLGLPLDLGASWIHGARGNPLSGLAQELDLKVKATGESYIIRGKDGRVISDAEAPDWIDNVVSVQHSLAADSAEINARAYWTDNDYGGDDVILPGGYDQVLKAVPRSVDIRLGHVLKRAALHSDGVELEDTKGRRASFDAAIVTVPLGVLKQGSITFSPPLPKAKSDAIAKLGMGTLDKVYLRYTEAFWDEDITWLITPETGLPQGQFNQWLNLAPYIGEPILVAFNGAQPARDLSRLSDAEIVARARQSLERAYPAG